MFTVWGRRDGVGTGVSGFRALRPRLWGGYGVRVIVILLAVNSTFQLLGFLLGRRF